MNRKPWGVRRGGLWHRQRPWKSAWPSSTSPKLDQSVQAARTPSTWAWSTSSSMNRPAAKPAVSQGAGNKPHAKLDPALAAPNIQTVWDPGDWGQAGDAPVSQPGRAAKPQPVAPPPDLVPEPPNRRSRSPPPSSTGDDLLSGPTKPPTTPLQPNQGLEYSADELLNPIKKLELRHTPQFGRSSGQPEVQPVPHACPGTPDGERGQRRRCFTAPSASPKYSEAPMAPAASSRATGRHRSRSRRPPAAPSSTTWRPTTT